MPEEYQVLSQFVDRVERGLIRQREKEMLQKKSGKSSSGRCAR